MCDASYEAMQVFAQPQCTLLGTPDLDSLGCHTQPQTKDIHYFIGPSAVVQLVSQSQMVVSNFISIVSPSHFAHITS